jgi:hypothetical protein
MSASRKLQLPEDLCAVAEKKFGAHFQSVEQLLEFVLRDLVHDSAAAADENEQRIVEERLRELGYI